MQWSSKILVENIENPQTQSVEREYLHVDSVPQFGHARARGVWQVCTLLVRRVLWSSLVFDVLIGVLNMSSMRDSGC
jgi:hypothetical protein